MERNPIVNGKFYPDEPSDLKAMIQGFNLKSSLKTTARGIVLPHAGFTYSGYVAASTVNKVLPKKRLLILGPNHSGKGAKFSLWPGDSWKILNKNIEIDKELAKAIFLKSLFFVDLGVRSTFFKVPSLSIRKLNKSSPLFSLL